MIWGPRTDDRVIDLAPPGWCWSRLLGATEGTLVYPTDFRAVELPVPYAVDDAQILVALAPVNVVGWRAVGQEAALVITGEDVDDVRWLVRATGHAVQAPTADRRARLLAPVRRRPALAGDGPADQLVLASVRVCGYRDLPTDDTAFPPGPPWDPPSDRTVRHQPLQERA